jgi:hypothetical protein
LEPSIGASRHTAAHLPHCILTWLEVCSRCVFVLGVRLLTHAAHGCVQTCAGAHTCLFPPKVSSMSQPAAELLLLSSFAIGVWGTLAAAEPAASAKQQQSSHILHNQAGRGYGLRTMQWTRGVESQLSAQTIKCARLNLLLPHCCCVSPLLCCNALCCQLWALRGSSSQAISSSQRSVCVI